MSVNECCPESRCSEGAISLDDALQRFRVEAERGICRTGRYRCAYYVWGQGPPLVFIHGLADSRFAFIPLISRLSRNFRCLAYDLPRGNGDSAFLPAYRHLDLVADLETLLDHLGFARSYLYGTSFGSTIALAAAARHPNRIPRIILQGGFARRTLVRGELLLARISRMLPGSMGNLPFRESALRRHHYKPFTAQSPEYWRYFLDLTGRSPISTTGYLALILGKVNLQPLLGSIRQPVLMLCGSEDPLIGRREEEALLKGLPNVERATINGCGHMAAYTHPDLLAVLVREFLTPPSADR